MKEDPKEDPKFKDSLAKTAKLHRKREGGERRHHCNPSPPFHVRTGHEDILLRLERRHSTRVSD